MSNTFNIFKDWLKNTKKVVDIKLTKMNWPNLMGLPIFDFRLESEVNGRKIKSSGINFTEELAFICCCAEFIERYFYYKYIASNPGDADTTNGVALHISEQLAKNNAILELVERDNFLRKFYSGGFSKDTDIICSKHPLLSNIRKALKQNHSIGVSFSILGRGSAYSILSMVDGLNLQNKIGITIGLGCSNNLIEACISAFCEAMVNFSAALFGKLYPIDIDEFGSLDSHSGIDHIKLGLNLEYAKIFMDFFEAEDIQPIDNKISSSQFSFQDFKLSDKLIVDIKDKIYIYRAKSDYYEKLFFGPIETQFFKKQKSIIPHPLG